MKTVEEKATEYVSNQFSKLEHSYEMQEMIFRTEDGFLAGYSEAMQWIDPNIELPDYYKKVIVKYERGDSKIDYACVSRLADDDGAYFFGDYHFDIFIDFDKVIGWKPIE